MLSSLSTSLEETSYMHKWCNNNDMLIRMYRQCSVKHGSIAEMFHQESFS